MLISLQKFCEALISRASQVSKIFINRIFGVAAPLLHHFFLFWCIISPPLFRIGQFLLLHQTYLLCGEEKAKTHYENEYFSVDIPADWADEWTVTEQDNSLNGIRSIMYSFSTSSGGASVYVLDMSDTSRPLSEYSRMIPSTCEEIGVTSSGYYDVFKTEAGAGFFSSGATISLK